MRTYGKLRERIKRKYGNFDSFAEDMGKSRTTISLKLNSKVPWDQNEIELACKILGILKTEITDYFFYDEGLDFKTL